MIRFNNIRYTYAPRGHGFTLGPLDIEIPPNMVVVWIGHNGSGKSSAARILTGDLQPDTGTIVRASGGAFYYGQHSAENAFTDLTLCQHFQAFGGDWRASFDASVRLFPDIAALGKRYPDELSGGQLQLFTFALALSRDYRILVLDEVVNHLDDQVRSRVLESTRDYLSKSGERYCVIVTHDLELARSAGRVQLFREGLVVADVPGNEIDGALAQAMRAL